MQPGTSWRPVLLTGLVIFGVALWWSLVSVAPRQEKMTTAVSTFPFPPPARTVIVEVPSQRQECASTEPLGMRPIAPAIAMRRLTIGPAAFYVWDSSTISWVMDGAAAERKVMNVFRTVLEQNRDAGDVVDIGANNGIYGLYASSLGYNTYLVDLQPMCQQYLNTSIWVNRLEGHTTLIPHAMGRDGGTTLKVSPLTPCVGNLRASTSSEFGKLTSGIDPRSFYTINTVRFDEVYRGASIALVKIDTEGFEAEVLSGMTRLLSERRVKHIVVEVTPLFWREFGMDRAKVAAELAALWDYGFTKATMFANAGEPITDRLFASKAELLQVLQHEDFIQRDFYFASV